MPEQQPMTLKIKPTEWQYKGIWSSCPLKRAIAHLGFGLRSRIPWCCAIEFSLRSFIPSIWGGDKVSCGSNPRCTSDFVHCAYHRHKFHPRRKPCATNVTSPSNAFRH